MNKPITLIRAFRYYQEICDLLKQGPFIQGDFHATLLKVGIFIRELDESIYKIKVGVNPPIDAAGSYNGINVLVLRHAVSICLLIWTGSWECYTQQWVDVDVYNDPLMELAEETRAFLRSKGLALP